ncbi:MAG: histidine triad nucleotide-binding protein [Ignavibacteriaceae bacterium]|nr:histidine triad nucleotide-binding protein [Ignavibacteriaceae bacterium]
MATIFSKIISKEIPADIVYETDNVLAFKDIKPQAPVHILIIPKIEIPKVTDIKGNEHSALLGEMFDAANKLAKDLGIDKNGFRLVFNCGNDGGQEVFHIHMHLLGGRHMNWPPG